MKKIYKWIKAKLNIRFVRRRCGHIFHFGWFRKSWWNYLLEKNVSWTKFWCRVFGHDCGVWWSNVGGTEPDMRCKNCDDYLG